MSLSLCLCLVLISARRKNISSVYVMMQSLSVPWIGSGCDVALLNSVIVWY